MSPPGGGGYRYDASNCAVCKFTFRKRFEKFRHGGVTETFKDESRRGKISQKKKIATPSQLVRPSPSAASLMWLVQYLFGIFAKLAKKPDGASALALAFSILLRSNNYVNLFKPRC